MIEELDRPKTPQSLLTQERRVDAGHESLKNYLLAIEDSMDGIAICDPSGNFTFMNRAHAKIFGSDDPSEFVGAHWSRLYDKEELVRWKNRMMVFLKDGRWRGEAVAMRKDGSFFQQEVSLTGISSGGIICVCRDITSRKENEETLRKVAEELIRSNRELEQFAYVASHDLREPLRMVSSFVELLLEDNRAGFSPDSLRYAEFIQEGVARMQILIRDLLTYSRVDRSRQEEQIFQIEEVLDVVQKNLQALIDSSNAKMSWGRSPKVRADFNLLLQLFQNLVENAVKYRRDQAPSIAIAFETKGGETIFSVADNGCGFNMDHHDRIFQLFQRLQGRQSGAGSGMGLAIAKKIVEGYGGRIWAESKENQGSTFYFTLPHCKPPGGS